MVSKNPATQSSDIIRIKNEISERINDSLAIEAPLEISISIPQKKTPILQKNISITTVSYTHLTLPTILRV